MQGQQCINTKQPEKNLIWKWVDKIDGIHEQRANHRLFLSLIGQNFEVLIVQKSLKQIFFETNPLYLCMCSCPFYHCLWGQLHCLLFLQLWCWLLFAYQGMNCALSYVLPFDDLWFFSNSWAVVVVGIRWKSERVGNCPINQYSVSPIAFSVIPLLLRKLLFANTGWHHGMRTLFPYCPFNHYLRSHLHCP